MGNCIPKLSGNETNSVGGDHVEQMIKVVTSTGGVMELYAPITAVSITTEFPGHRLFLAGKPLLPCDHLHYMGLINMWPQKIGGPVLMFRLHTLINGPVWQWQHQLPTFEGSSSLQDMLESKFLYCRFFMY